MNKGVLTTLGVTHLPQAKPLAAGAMLRLLLYKGEVHRLSQAARDVQVLAGQGWLTVGGEDVFVAPGEKVSFPTSKDGSLISALGKIPLILEIY